ncbi:hypothetical protein O6H91_13G042800 [Diphasiastrum complanatum]|uniref:Uncharacterized protein n=1 Tax=Diphasiastrum complanatum TaxID=34168 RepID=A0ACC2BVA8_DIPCM|nr:hypothetical protein O6H91_13G042800 [Diphasiastrum complanatum]
MERFAKFFWEFKFKTSYFYFLGVLAVFAAQDVIADGNVTLDSMTIHQTHEWFGKKPTIYFRCKGEEKVFLPDVKEKYHLYTFIGEESFQPLTVLEGQRCKRCGLYEEDHVLRDDVFDEWEFCPASFTPAPEGRYVHVKENEFNASFLCSKCHDSNSDSSSTLPSEAHNHQSAKGKVSGITVLLIFFGVLLISAVGTVAYILWRKKLREEQHARFIRMFEDDEDFDAEFGFKSEL